MKLIALDVGTKRIGVAKADSKVRIAIPYTAVEVNGEEFKKIASLARAWDINNFVIGLPRNSEGVETKQSEYVRRFAAKLKKSIPGARVCFQDESLTSVEAEKRLKSRKKNYKKGDIDSEAAAIILQDFIEEKTGKTTTRAASAKGKSVRGARPRRLTAIVVAIVAFILLGGGAAGFYYFYNLRPVIDMSCDAPSVAAYGYESCDTTTFAIATGASVRDIAESLKGEGLIRDSLVFQIHYRISSGGDTFKAGEYDLRKDMSVGDITELFLSGGEQTFSFTIFPGDRVRDIRTRLIDVGFEDAIVDASLERDYRGESFGWIFAGMPEDQNSLEGYLFGETYEFYKADTPDAIITRFLEETAKQLKSGNYEARFKDHGFSLYEGITLASVVQREANTAEDMAKVARIFMHRLEDGMTMGSDVTAAYAADLLDPNREVYTDNAAILDIDSPYNTRKHAGLPYGPISNPGIDALNAVATPDESVADYYFFLTGDDGMMYYSITEDEHLQNVSDHCQELCNLGL